MLSKEEIQDIAHKSNLSREEAMFHWSLTKERLNELIEHHGFPYNPDGPRKKTFNKSQVEEWYRNTYTQRGKKMRVA